MNFLFEPAVQLMNRLKYSYKFGVIGFLIILQASVLIYMLVSGINKNIDSTMKERIGVQYVQALLYVFDEGQAYRSIHFAYLQGDRSLEEAVLAHQARVDAALDEVEAIDKRIAGQLDTAWKLQMLRQDWLARKQDIGIGTGRAHVAFDLDSRWLNEVIDLMQHAGYESNLAMDSDFDISYLVDSVLRKLPGLLDTLGMAQGLAVQLFDDNLSMDNRNHLLQVVGLASSALEQVNHNAQLVIRHNQNVKDKLGALCANLTDTVPVFSWNFEQKTIGEQGLPISQQLLSAAGNQALQNAGALHKEELKVIDELLVSRIEKDLRYRNGVVIFTGGILLIVCYLFWGFDISVRKGVYQLDNVMACAGNGNLDVRGEIYSHDEMGSLTGAINNTLDSLQKMYQEVQSSHAQLAAWNQELEHKVAERTASLRNLLDHAGQGFLSFGQNLRIDSEYSAECTAIFQQVIADQAVSILIYPEDRDQQTFLEAVFAKIFQEKNNYLRDTYFSLLPEEITIGSRYIGIVYRMIHNAVETDQGKIMLILTDRTLQKAMEDQVQDERDILAMIVHVVTHSSDFFAAVSQYKSFCQDGMPGLLQEKKPAAEVLAALFRTVHTFKGTFGQLRMKNITNQLHAMESRLDAIRTNEITELAADQLTEKLGLYTPEAMLGWLHEDLEVLKEKLGESFFQRENILLVDNARLLEIEEKVQCTLPPEEAGLLLPDLRRLRYKPLKELLQSYPEYVCGLAERNGKAIYPFKIQGGETLVDPLQYYDFMKSLGHVFRNSIVHGVETLDERLENGKDEIGTITCSIEETTAGFVLKISDDGRGIDVARIRDIAMKKGMCTLAEADSLPEADWLHYIFTDGFSGAKNVDELAGRGVGLSAVRAELEKLGGSVAVHTTPGKGTQFEFFLPVTRSGEGQFYSLRQLAQPLLNAAQKCLNEAGLPMAYLTHPEGGETGKLALRKVSAFLTVKGFPAGRILISTDQEVAQYLLDRQNTADIGDSLDKRMEKVLLQYAQAIFGQAVGQLPDWAGKIKAEALVSILAENASVKYSQVETSTWGLKTALGSINLSLIY